MSMHFSIQIPQLGSFAATFGDGGNRGLPSGFWNSSMGERFPSDRRGDFGAFVHDACRGGDANGFSRSPQADFSTLMQRLCPNAQGGESSSGIAARLQNAADRLDSQTPQDDTSYRVNQSSQALVGDAQRLLTAPTVPTEFKRVLSGELDQLSRENGPGRSTQRTAREIAGTLDKLSATAPFNSYATNQTIAQARSDVGYLQQAAGQQRQGSAPAQNDLVPQVQDLIDQTDSQPLNSTNQGANAALRSIESDLQSVAANTGGQEMPSEVRDRLQSLISSVGDAVQGTTPLTSAPTEIGAKLNDFVQTLHQAIGGSYGAKGSLLALSQDLGSLSRAAMQQSYMMADQGAMQGNT